MPLLHVTLMTVSGTVVRSILGPNQFSGRENQNATYFAASTPFSPCMSQEVRITQQLSIG